MNGFLTTSLLLVTYLRITAGAECLGLTEAQITKLRESKVKEKCSSKMNGEFNLVWAPKGLPEKMKCAEEKYFVSNDKIYWKVKPVSKDDNKNREKNEHKEKEKKVGEGEQKERGKRKPDKEDKQIDKKGIEEKQDGHKEDEKKVGEGKQEEDKEKKEGDTGKHESSEEQNSENDSSSCESGENSSGDSDSSSSNSDSDSSSSSSDSDSSSSSSNSGSSSSSCSSSGCSNSGDSSNSDEHGHKRGSFKTQILEIEDAVFEMNVHGRPEKQFIIYASDTVLAIVCCDTEDHDSGEKNEGDKHEKPPLVRSFIKVKRGKTIEDADIKGDYMEAKNKMDSLGIEITKEMAQLTEKC